MGYMTDKRSKRIVADGQNRAAAATVSKVRDRADRLSKTECLDNAESISMNLGQLVYMHRQNGDVDSLLEALILVDSARGVIESLLKRSLD